MKIAKAIAAAVGLVATSVSGALADNVFDFNEVGVVVTYLLTGAASVWAVWRVENERVD